MKSHSLLFSIVFVFCSQTALCEPSAIRLEYHGAETPDYLAYYNLLKVAPDYSLARFEIVVWVELNTIWDEQSGKWLWPGSENRVVSREDASYIARRILVDSGRLSTQSTERALKLCEAQSQDSEALFALYRESNDDLHAGARQIYTSRLDRLQESEEDRLIAWLARIKAGFHGVWYDHAVRWRGKESAFEEQHQLFCDSHPEVIANRGLAGL